MPPRSPLTTEYVAAEIRALMARRRITSSTLAVELGVTPMWLSRRLRGVTPLTIDDTGRIAAALHVDPVDLLPHPDVAANIPAQRTAT